ncbi:ATPase family AAA domain-containing protein 5 [Cebus imitator]|uniref:ATPase family AAA domain-containing protein 5 n=1 Tax=Cebus imitator TaxID=2715852 RepID=UPI000809F443|nr:ATPase family AAA domain-containing protein 5 [Cebus imitator]
MVGVLAMAAAAAPPPVKDYEIEPCKKRRKDNDRSSCKTITKYLSPLGKTGDRLFAPPKPSNILDYFRKTSPTNEKTQLGKECKIKSSESLPVDSSKDCKTPLEMFSNVEFKKKRKRVNLAHQLNNTKTENEAPIEISSDDSKDDCSLNNDLVESSTSVLHYKKQVEVLGENIQDIKSQPNTVSSLQNSKKVNLKQGTTKNDFKKLRKRKCRDVVDLSESLPLAEELNWLKKDGKDSKQMENTTSHANSRDHVTEAAQLNDSTITVSYEEFLKSHKENQVEEIPDSAVSICVPSETLEEIVRSGYTSESENSEISQQVRFKTVTVLAQVHPIPPKKIGKIPPIFLKQKQFEMENSLSDPENEQTVQKRKSNVVIQEEELELAVLEAGSSEAVKPKCTLEERQQFMKAFRQPASDALKNGVKKSSDKQKDFNEKSLREEGRDDNSKKIMENSSIQMVSKNGNSQSHTDKGSFPKEKSKKLKKKNNKTLDTGAIPGENIEGDTQKKETSVFLKEKQYQNRMSLRQKKTEFFKSSTLFDNESLVSEDIANDDLLKVSFLCNNNKSSRKTSIPVKDIKVTRSKAESEDSLLNVSTPKSTRRSGRINSTPTTETIRGIDSEDVQDSSPIKASTPKAANLLEKHSLYTAELITVPFDSESPIRMKFTRISTPKKSKKKSNKRSEKSEATDGDFISQTRKASNASKNISKAKQLIEKAKALHISRSKVTEEIVIPLRRSSRHQILSERKKLSETEVSITNICWYKFSPILLFGVGEENYYKVISQKDVLKVAEGGDGKMKVAPLFLARKAQKAADPVPSFDESRLISTCISLILKVELEPDVNHKETKRKRVEAENSKSKRKKPNEYSENLEKTNRKSEELGKRKNSSGIKRDYSKDSGTEDMLWTEKYQPQTASELIGNELAIKKLHSWLKDWKRRAELEERQNLKGKRDEKQEDVLDSIDFKGSSDDEESCLCNTVLISGPTGVGKTAAVYACAQELGFKIFEVNASSQRSGRQILSQLKEATQSHQVDKQGVNSQKPCFFNSYNIGKSPKKISSPKKVVTSPRKVPPPSPKSSGPKRALPPKTLANYFKVSSKRKNNEEIGMPLENNKGIKNFFEQKQITQTKSTNATNSNVKDVGAEEPNRKNATSLILFEEVDVIFDEDAGFLNAIKTFMATTKRPVILTTSDPTFSLMFDGCFEEIKFNTPSLLNVASYLQMICLTENFRTDVKDFVTLLAANNCDIRKSILYLHYWIRSGGGFLEERPLTLYRGNSRNVQLVCSEDGLDNKIHPKNTKRKRADLPKCDSGCAETLFGLRNIFSPSEDLFSFLKHKITTKEEWHKLIQLLTEFQMRNVDFLYNNLEFILPLPVDTIPETKNLCGSAVTVDTSGARKNMKCLGRKHSEREQPLKKSQKKKQKKKLVTLDDSDLFDTDLDFPDEFTSLSPVSSSSNSEENKARDKGSNPETKKSISCPPRTPAGKKSSPLVSHCLNSLSEFMDNMSFLDALLTDVREQKEYGRNDFSWTNGKVKSGLCDEFSLESNDGWTSQSSGELKAAAEALSFTKCSSTISKALETLNSCKKLGKDPTNDLTFYVSQKRNNVYFTQSAANLDNAWKRIAVIKSVFSSRSLLYVGNRQASIIEYLPTLRNICKTEKLKEQGKSKRRFLHYFEGIHLDIPKETVNTLAADFP